MINSLSKSVRCIDRLQMISVVCFCIIDVLVLRHKDVARKTKILEPMNFVS